MLLTCVKVILCGRIRRFVARFKNFADNPNGIAMQLLRVFWVIFHKIIFMKNGAKTSTIIRPRLQH